MKRAFIVGALLICLLALGLQVATSRLSQPKFDERLSGDPLDRLDLAPLEIALTFARIESSGGPSVVLVKSVGPDGLFVVPLATEFGEPSPDPVEIFATYGFDALAQIALESPTVQISMEDLTLPLDASYPHIAAGTNFREHAEEVGRDDGPFLFPKLSEPTPWNADVPYRGRLDYEVELCGVTLGTHTAEQPASLGYVLCNDFTDRWMLVQDIELDGPMGLSGFPDAKGGDGMLPIGPFLVIPRDADTFYRDLSLELYVDGALRQRALGGQMIWSPLEIVARALSDCDVAYQRRTGEVGLTECAGIPPRTLVLTGTPGGVMFQLVTLWSADAYLKPGDEVTTIGTHLGVLKNHIR
jgi:2,4-diketo-3-deoxy-L-fuconate hydrolase